MGDNKYHIIVIYLVDEGGGYGGGYKLQCLHGFGSVTGGTFEEMLEDAYEVLRVCIEGEDQASIPFDTNNIKESVVFDCVECYNPIEMDEIGELENQGKSFTELIEALQKMRET